MSVETLKGSGAMSEDAKSRCSFCTKSQDDVRTLIAGPAVFICDECVAVCVDILGTDWRWRWWAWWQRWKRAR